MSRSEFRPDDSHPDLTCDLEQHLLAGFPPDLALDLVLNELVVRAAKATRAASAALALARGEELVCRAATGPLAPDLGVPLSTRDGLSGACLQTHQPQLSVDTEFDPESIPPSPVASASVPSSSFPSLSYRQGSYRHGSNETTVTTSTLRSSGVLEVFSPLPPPSPTPTKNCWKVLPRSVPAFAKPPSNSVSASPPPPSPRPRSFFPRSFCRMCGLITSRRVQPARLFRTRSHRPLPSPKARCPLAVLTYRTLEVWTLVLGALAIVAAIAVSFLIGSRIGWLRSGASSAQTAPSREQPYPSRVNPRRSPPPAEQSSATLPTAKSITRKKARPAAPASAELVVYEKGKVIFRMKPTPTRPGRPQPSYPPTPLPPSNRAMGS